MSRDQAIAALEAEIERREDEIVAMREVIAMLQGGGVVAASPPVEQPQVPATVAPPAPRQARSRWGAMATVVIGDVKVELSERQAQALELLQAGPVSADGMEEIFGAGQARHDGVHALKKKLETAGLSIQWRKVDGYSLINRPEEQ